MKTHQQGSAHIIIVGLVIALLGALGWIFLQNFIDKDSTKENMTQSIVDKENDEEQTEKIEPQVEEKYTDFRTNGDSTGILVATRADVAKLTNVGLDLKAYLEENVGKPVEGLNDETIATTYTIDRLYGNYAAGAGLGAYFVWGPEAGNGPIKALAGTQSDGFSCKDLKAAKVPPKLVDGRCLGSTGMATYN